MQTDSITLLCSCQYDPLDRLVDYTLSGQDGTRRFYQKDRLTTEIHGAMKRSIIQYEDQLLAQQQRRSGAEITSLLATDQQRSVLNVLDASTPRPIAHTPYGHRPLASGLLSLLGFNGERPDPVTGHYLLGNGYRAFNPILMRFNSPDSWSPFGKGGLNAYAYCVGDPVNRRDPTGHIPNFLKPALRFFGIIGKSGDNRHMKNLTPMGDNAYIFEDVVNGKSRLNISAHGTLTLDNEPAQMITNQLQWSADQLHSGLKLKGYDFDNFDITRLIMCNSANGGNNSFAARFANLTQTPSTGFQGRVSASHRTEDVIKIFNLYKKKYPNAPEKYLAKRYARKKLAIHQEVFPSKPITFDPVRDPI